MPDSDLISLPQGGGALRSIGDLQTGTGNYRVPLEVPAGRNGLQPNLALAYSSGAGNSPFGLGWSLDVSCVQRKTSKGIPRYGTQDVFILSGAALVQVPIPGASMGVTGYRPWTEGLFARILHHTESGSDYWEVLAKDGLRSLYGTPRPANPPSSWRDPAVVVDSGGSRIFAWRLTATTDPLGNRIESDYVPGGPGEVQIYLSGVRYADYPAGNRRPHVLLGKSSSRRQRNPLTTRFAAGG